jgi:hypothetical protein
MYIVSIYFFHISGGTSSFRFQEVTGYKLQFQALTDSGKNKSYNVQCWKKSSQLSNMRHGHRYFEISILDRIWANIFKTIYLVTISLSIVYLSCLSVCAR